MVAISRRYSILFLIQRGSVDRLLSQASGPSYTSTLDLLIPEGLRASDRLRGTISHVSMVPLQSLNVDVLVYLAELGHLLFFTGSFPVLWWYKKLDSSFESSIQIW